MGEPDKFRSPRAVGGANWEIRFLDGRNSARTSVVVTGQQNRRDEFLGGDYQWCSADGATIRFIDSKLTLSYGPSRLSLGYDR
jgi:hypothetical protein